MVAQRKRGRKIFWQTSASIANGITQKGQNVPPRLCECNFQTRKLNRCGRARFQFGQPLGEQGFQLDERGRESLNAFLEFVGGHAVVSMHAVEGSFVDFDFVDSVGLGRFGRKLARQITLRGFELAEQLRRDGEQVASCKAPVISPICCGNSRP